MEFKWGINDRSVAKVVDRPGAFVYIVHWKHEDNGKPFAVQCNGYGRYYFTIEEAVGYVEGRFKVELDANEIMTKLMKSEVFDNDEDALKSMRRIYK
jgi:hypothetical protein